jgi:TonB family protein
MRPCLRRAAFLAAFCLVTISFAARVSAQNPPDSADAGAPVTPAPTPPALTPPALTGTIDPGYPDSARGTQAEPVITLEVTISAAGEVTDARVVSEPRADFDALAVAAMRAARFEPARRNGTAIPARIRFQLGFRMPDADRPPPEPEPVPEDVPPAEPPPPPPARLVGRVRSRDGDAALAGARVTLLREGQPPREAITGPDGSFAFDELAPGTARVRVEASEYESREDDEQLVSGEETDVVYRLDEAEDVEAFRATARAEPPPREVTRRTITSEELTRIPGTRGDALRAIELLPGVGRPPGLAGLVLIRGASPNDSQVFLDGQPVPLLYHFGGLTSFYNSRMIDRIDFYPGNFSVRYGRKVGGVIDVGVRDGRVDQVHGVADVNLVDASLLLEVPLGERASLAVAGRRSYIDFFLNDVLPEGTISLTAAPVYYDYQSALTWKPTSRDRIRLQIYGSSDRFEAALPAPADGDPAVRGSIDLSTQFHRFQASWKRALTPDVDQNLEFTFGSTNLRIAVGNAFRLQIDTLPINGRAEWTMRLARRVRLIAGMDIQSGPTDIAFIGPAPAQQDGDTNGTPFSSREQFIFSGSETVYRPAAYVEAALRPIDPLQIVLGLRLDWYRDIKWWSFDPRLSARYTLSDRWAFKAGIGMFSQPPEFQESADLVGNANLLPQRALHVSAGVDHRFDQQFSLGVEGFYKNLDQVIVSNDAGLRFDNGGIGRIYGLEVAGRANPVGRFFGFVSYTLMRSERRDGPGEPWRLYDFDQTHILTLSGVYRLGRGWEAGATFRLISGNPTTPIVGSIYDTASDLYIPVSGATNSDRNPFFHRLDLRIEKLWRFQHWKLALYLDVQNVYNRQNIEGIQYNFDFRQSAVIGGLPIIPSLGVRGEL